jgi:hypothetical protein
LARRRWPPRYCASLGLDGLLDRDRCEERVDGGGIMGASEKPLLNLSISSSATGEKDQVFRSCSVRASYVRQAALGRFDGSPGERDRARFIRVNAMCFWTRKESNACLWETVTCQARQPKTNNAKTNNGNVTQCCALLNRSPTKANSSAPPSPIVREPPYSAPDWLVRWTTLVLVF